MKLEFDTLDLPTRREFRIAREGEARLRRSVWVRLHDADGVEGWGEAAATPYYGETAETVVAMLPRLGEVLAGEADDPLALQRIESALAQAAGRWASKRGVAHPSARAALSAALHDLVGKRFGAPLWRLWGFSPAMAPLSSYTVGLDEPERMRERVRAAASYPILKLKVGTSRDEDVLRLIRNEAPDQIVRVDANTGWSVQEALARLPMLEAYNVELVEQPLAAADLGGSAQLRRRSRLPIVADESCVTAAEIPRLAGSFDGINIKLAKCGSLREALRMVHVARAHGLGVMLGCMIESTLGIAAAVQLAPLVDWADLDGAALLARDPFRGPGLEPDGTLRFNEEAGLGVEQAS